MSQPPPQARTVDEAVLLLRVDAGEVPGAAAAVPLRVLPGAPAGEVAVAVALELVPVVVAALRVCGDMGTLGTGASPQRPGTHGDAPRCGGGSRVLPRRGRGWIWPVMLPSGGTRGLPRASLPTFLAAAAPVAGQAEADEGVDLVDAGAAVLAGARQAVVDVCGDGGGLWARRDPPPAPSCPRRPHRQHGHGTRACSPISQFSPVKPWAQLQLQTEPLAWQVPPCRHGLFWHGSAGAAGQERVPSRGAPQCIAPTHPIAPIMLRHALGRPPSPDTGPSSLLATWGQHKPSPGPAPGPWHEDHGDFSASQWL